MNIRVGKVTNVYPATGKVQVHYEDEGNTSLPLSMLTMNNEVSMPSVGEYVLTIHMSNGSSKGFVLGTYYGGSTKPKATGGYYKDLGGGAYIACQDGTYTLKANNIAIQASDITITGASGSITLKDLIQQLEEVESALEEIQSKMEEIEYKLETL